MAGAASISGLASGLDTATIIAQLMQLEAVRRTASRPGSPPSSRPSRPCRTLNAKVASLAGKATELAKAGAWTPVIDDAPPTRRDRQRRHRSRPGSFSCGVDRTAMRPPARLRLRAVSRHGRPARSPRACGSTSSTAPPRSTSTTDGTLQGLVDAINVPANETGLRATAVSVGDGPVPAARRVGHHRRRHRLHPDRRRRRHRPAGRRHGPGRSGRPDHRRRLHRRHLGDQHLRRPRPRRLDHARRRPPRAPATISLVARPHEDHRVGQGPGRRGQRRARRHRQA